MDHDLPGATHDTPEPSLGVAAPRGSHPGVPAARLVLEMPVELWFGEHHIGVKGGSATCAEFRRFANAILADYRAATHPRD